MSPHFQENSEAATTSTTHFGYQDVPKQHKAHKVAEVFHSVARNYDVMNDVMSLGLHRFWKRAAIRAAAVRPGMRVLDIAGGTGDLSRAFCERLQGTGEVWLTDINESMLNVGRDRLLDAGFSPHLALCDAEKLPFSNDFFDVVTVAFGLRNMTNKDQALAEMCRVVKPGGKVLVLEFSKINPVLAAAYDWYSFQMLPRLGQCIANDRASYQYLAESIRMHPDQDTLKTMMLQSGFDKVSYENFTAGLVALHRGLKFS